jgi:hypothetical protein
MAKGAQAKAFGVKKMLAAARGLSNDIEKSASEALTGVGAFYAREIKTGIVRQAPGGRKFKPLAASTLKSKTNKKGKAKNKALINDSDLKNSITWKRDGMNAVFIGLLRTTKHPKYPDGVANLGAIHEYGSKKKVDRPPARPFISPVVKSMRSQMRAQDVYFQLLHKRLNMRARRRGYSVSRRAFF